MRKRNKLAAVTDLNSARDYRLRKSSDSAAIMPQFPTPNYEEFIAFGNVIKKLSLEKIIDLDKQVVTLTEVDTPYKKIRSISIQPFLDYSGTSSDIHIDEEISEEVIIIKAISSTFDKVNSGLSNLIAYLDNLETELRKNK